MRDEISLLAGEEIESNTWELSGVLGEAAVSLTRIKRWCRRFKDGNFSLDDEFRSGQPRDDIGETRSQFRNKESSLLHGFSQRGLY
jgi:hypothetical protein